MGEKKNQSYQFLLKFKPPLVTRPSISYSFTQLHVGLFCSAHCLLAISLFRACFLSSEPFGALTRSVKESALSYNINTDITSLQQRARSLIWKFSSNEFHVIIDKQEKWVMELQYHFAPCLSVCIKCVAFAALRLMTISNTHQPCVFSLHKLTTNSLECLQRIRPLWMTFFS